MTKIVKVSVAVLMGSSVLVVGAEQMKLYDVKSGKIEYSIKGSGEIMGSKMQTVGKKRVIFDAYGAKNLTEENKIEKQTIMGQKNINKSHTLTYVNDGMVYIANFDHKRIIRTVNMGASMGALFANRQNKEQSVEEMMIVMGGKKTGTDTVLGYTCDVWNIMSSVKQCIYKGVPLRIETDVMGLKTTEVATKAEFDLSLSKDDFKLPDFPIYDMQGNKLDKSKLDAMDKHAGIETARGAEDMAALGTSMAAAMQSAGVKKGERPTQAQEEQMKNAMMASMLPRMKREMLAEEKVMLYARECLSKADTLKEANICEDKMDETSGESSDMEDKLQKWDDKTKKETLGFIDMGLKNIECVKKANSMQDMKQCMPQ